jgi:Protein of unknown function (DUF2852)
MSYETHANADGTAKGEHHFRGHNRDSFGWAKRPGFHPLKAAAVVGGVLIFPPLGLAALAYFIWNERRAGNDAPHFSGHRGMGRGGCGRARGRTGNAAFDEHRANVMQNLEDERVAFEAHRAEERRKRDEDAFEAFKAKQADKGDAA